MSCEESKSYKQSYLKRQLFAHVAKYATFGPSCVGSQLSCADRFSQGCSGTYQNICLLTVVELCLFLVIKHANYNSTFPQAFNPKIFHTFVSVVSNMSFSIQSTVMVISQYMKQKTYRLQFHFYFTSTLQVKVSLNKWIIFKKKHII